MSWDPFRELRAWQDRLEQLGPRHGGAWAPPIDIYETGDRYVITAELPGLERNEIEIALEDGRLTIRGTRPERTDGRGGSVHYHQIERGHGPFSRTFDFAESIQPDAVAADLKDGVLTVVLPKVAPPPVRKIEVQ